jgi:histidinol-phosphate aminotransferase
VNTTAIHALARPEVAPLPAYNAGLSSEAVRARYGVDEIARLASNENPYGASPAVARRQVDQRARAPTPMPTAPRCAPRSPSAAARSPRNW